MEILDYWYWAGLKCKMRKKFNAGELDTVEKRKKWVEQTSVDEFQYEQCEKAICGTKLNDGTVTGGYKSRLQSVLAIQGENLITLSRKERQKMNLMSIDELFSLTFDGDEEFDDFEDVDPYTDADDI